jgi:DNA invertase Pin-like site-specific DNA recombinase
MSEQTLNTNLLNVISLLRVSGDGQDVARQRTDQERTKRKFGLDITRSVELVGVSGTATLNNDQVEQILSELKQPDIHGIQVSSLDRLFRPGKRYGQFAILDRFVDEGKCIWSAREGLIDPSTDEGYDKCLSAGGRAGAEWRELRRRTCDGKRETAEAGFLPHGNPKFGWDIVGRKQTGVVRQGRAVINETEAAVAREMFEARHQGTATYAIAASLNQRGIRNKPRPNGEPAKPWSRTTVLQILRSRDYIGKHMWKGIEIAIPAIVSEQLFFDVQAAMKTSGKKWAGRPSKLYRLRNFLWCEICKHRCVGVRNRNKLAYRCGHRTNKPPIKQICPVPQVSAAAIEKVAWDAIWSTLRDPKLLLEMGRHYYDAQAKPEKNMQELERGMARLRQLERNLGKSMEDAQTDAECDRLRADRKEIRAKIAELEVELRATDQTATLPPLHAVQTALDRITAGPEPETYDEQRDIMERIIDLRMEYAEGNLTIEGKIPIASDDPTVGNTTVKNCYSRVNGDSSSVPFIPFILKRRVA